MRFRFVDAEKACFPVTVMCRVLRVSTSGFYAWRRRPESARAAGDRRLTVLVREAYEVGRRYYGSPRVHRELAAHGIRVSRKRVIRLMQQEGTVGRKRHRYKGTTDSKHDQMAIRRRCPDAGLLHHSDRGSPYASEDYQKILAANGITCSTSRRGNCIDNAAMES